MNVFDNYNGLPLDFKNKIQWVSESYRINKLSQLGGGSEIIIEYKNGKILGYNRVKRPSSFIRETLNNVILGLDSSNENAISRIFYRTTIKPSEPPPFKEIWNHTSKNLNQLTLIENYSENTRNKFLNFFENNLQFTKQYLSIHYPFEYYDLISNWDYIEKGDAFYSALIYDIETIQYPKFGLSFNKNIRWNNKLKAKYDIGIINFFDGTLVGTGEGDCEIEERDFLDILPLDTIKEIDIRNNVRFSAWFDLEAPYIYFHEDDFYLPKTYEIEEIFRIYDTLNYDKFISIFEDNKLTILLNDSIWENTIKHIVDESFCQKILNLIKNETA